MQIAAHKDVCHDDCAATEHDVGFSFDLGLARDFVAGVLWVVDIYQ